MPAQENERALVSECLTGGVPPSNSQPQPFQFLLISIDLKPLIAPLNLPTISTQWSTVRHSHREKSQQPDHGPIADADARNSVTTAAFSNTCKTSPLESNTCTHLTRLHHCFQTLTQKERGEGGPKNRGVPMKATR
jgi:hypothetical protein